MNLRLSLLLALLFSSSACGPSEEELFQALVEEAQTCEQGDTCVMAGFGRCGCGVPVREEKAMEVDQAAPDRDSLEWLTGCPATECSVVEPTCVDGLCTQAEP